MAGIIAPRTYRPGDLIYEEEAFAHVLFTPEACETCLERSPDLKSCKKCLEVKYCGKECQTADWRDHKLECKHMKNLPKEGHRSFVRLMGKVILKVKNKDWKSIRRRVVNTNITFDDIGSCETQREKTEKNILFRKNIKELTRKYIGEQNMPAEKDFHKIFEKVLLCDILGKKISARASFVFLGLSQFTEECIPNTNFVICNNTLKISACKEIKKRSEKITVMTLDHLPESLFKNIDTMNKKCKCTDCSLPYGKSVLSKIVDENRAFSVICETECLLNTAHCFIGLPLSLSDSQVDELLKRQEKVLGDTHILHLELLKLKCFQLGDHPDRLKELLRKCEECSRRQTKMAGIIAPRTYRPGDLIYEEEPFARVLLTPKACEICHNSLPALKVCKNCLEVKYCSKACQKADWSDHKLECEHMKNLPKRGHRDFVRLLGKVILKVKDKDWKSIRRRVVNTNITFDDIGSYDTDREEDVRSILYRKEIKELTRKYIGEQNMPTEEDFQKIFETVMSCNVLGSDSSTATCFVFLGLSQFTEECIPNANYVIKSNILKIWACKKIKKGSVKMTVKTLENLPELLFGNIDRMNNKCKCTDCTLPYGESVLSKIIDENRAFSVIYETEDLLKAADTFIGLPLRPSASDVDELLQRQEEVLGDTHILHLKLLGLKCFELEDHPYRLKALLKKYEACTRKVYGEYSVELVLIYKKYMDVCFQLGHFLEAASYKDKLRKVNI